MQALEQVVPRRRVPWLLVGGGVAVATIAAVAVLWPKLHKASAPPTPQIVMSAPPTASPVSPAPAAVQAIAPSVAPAPGNATATASASALPPGFKLGAMMSGVALRGSLYRVADIPADPANCQAECRADQRCIAWTYTQPNLAGGAGRCSFKAVIPAGERRYLLPLRRARARAGVARSAANPAGVAGALARVELEGGTYRLGRRRRRAAGVPGGVPERKPVPGVGLCAARRL